MNSDVTETEIRYLPHFCDPLDVATRRMLGKQCGVRVSYMRYKIANGYTEDEPSFDDMIRVIESSGQV